MKKLQVIGLLPILLLISCNPPIEVQSLSQSQLQKLASQTLPDFELREGFEIELFAAEPLLSDPVAMEIDENGQIYVVEMHGYPLDVSGSGIIRQLSDTDGDGYPDKSTVFADNLVLPMGIMRWKQGFLVPDAPDLLYLEDSDGDGKADIRDVILTGFARSNPQHNFNSPVYGLDNLVYLANENYITTLQHADILGDEGTEVYFPAAPDAPRLPPNAYDRNVRFHPDKHQIEMLSSMSQYGHTFDPWGHYFQTSNASHLHHEVLASTYLSRKPELLIADAQQYVPSYGHPIEVYAIAKSPQHQLLTDVGTITSACSITWYQGGSFPDSFNQVVFTAEPTHNLIHADKILKKGASFSSVPLYREEEFLASRDPLFRPVSLYQGPDGAMYIMDYHRPIIEHPEWMAESVNKSGQLYQGKDQGRIYRIKPHDFVLESSDSKMGDLATEALVDYLSHPNIWWRKNAQRLLVDRQDKSVEASLRKILSNPMDSLGTLHALWTLEGLGKLEPDDIRKALNSPIPGIRENGLVLAERQGNLVAWLAELEQMVQDPDPRVRFQLMCTLGEVSEAEESLLTLMFENLEDPWMSLAALTSPYLESQSLFDRGIEEAKVQAPEMMRGFFENLGATVSLDPDKATQQAIIKKVLWENKASWQEPMLSGFFQALRSDPGLFVWKQESLSLLLKTALESPNGSRDIARKVLSTVDPALFTDLENIMYAAEAIIGNNTNGDELRADAIALLALLKPDRYDETFVAYLKSHVTQPLQLAAVEGLGKLSEDRGCIYLLTQWATLTPEIRTVAVDQFMRKPSRINLLLQAIEDSIVQAPTLGWPRTVRLMNHDDPELKSHARSILAPEEEEAEAVFGRFSQVLDQGEAAKGYTLYKQHCSSCHTYKGKEGITYGPDLASLRNRLAESLLRDILFPNRAIADGYELWECNLNSGQTFSGIMGSETATTLTLLSPDGSNQVLVREQIKSLKAQAYSAMPSGLGKQISPKEMADLISFIKGGYTETISFR